MTEVVGTRGQLTPDKKLCCPKEAARCFVSVISRFSSTKRQAQSSIISYTLALDLPLRKVNYVLLVFSSAYLLVRGFLCRKQTCTVTVIHHWTDHRQLSTSSSKHRSIDAGYRLTIVLVVAGRHSFHSMR